MVPISDTQSVTAVIDAANFAGSVTGTGTFDVTTTSFASSSEAGDANLRTLLHTNAGAVLSSAIHDDEVAAGGTNDGGGSIGVVATLVFGTPVNVITIFDNATTTAPQVITLPNATSGWRGNAVDNQFDPFLGTLLGVEINVGNAVTGTFSAENLGSSAGCASVSASANLTVVDVRSSTSPPVTSFAGQPQRTSIPVHVVRRNDRFRGHLRTGGRACLGPVQPGRWGGRPDG